MEVRSIYKYARISPFKVREVTREIQGLPVSAALDVLAFTPKKAAFLINKTLKSAIANAENNANLKADGLVVKEAVVGEGPTFKRMTPRARGSGSRILKRTSHIRIVLDRRWKGKGWLFYVPVALFGRQMFKRNLQKTLEVLASSRS